MQTANLQGPSRSLLNISIEENQTVMTYWTDDS